MIECASVRFFEIDGVDADGKPSKLYGIRLYVPKAPPKMELVYQEDATFPSLEAASHRWTELRHTVAWGDRADAIETVGMLAVNLIQGGKCTVDGLEPA